MAEPTDEDILADAVRSTEHEILDQAFSDEPQGDEQPSDQDQVPPQAKSDPPEQPRKENGQYAPKDQAKSDDQPPTPEPKGDQAEPTGDERGDSDVPRWRLREIAEERRTAVAERDTLRAELSRLQTQQRAQPAPQQQTPEPQKIDPLLDPEGWQRQIEGSFEQRLRTMELNSDLRIAHMQHGKDFEKAYEALVQTGQRDNGQLIRQLTSQAQGAGERIVTWFRNQELLRDPVAYVSKNPEYTKTLRAELLKDPEFLKEAQAAMRTQAAGGQSQQPGRPNTITRLPPSLSRTAGSSQMTDPVDTDDSEKAVFDYAFK